MKNPAEIERQAKELMDAVANEPGAIGNMGRLYAARANLLLAGDAPLSIPERWYELLRQENAALAGVKV